MKPTAAILFVIYHDLTTYFYRVPKSTAGLLVDWLQLLDPELVSQAPDVQQQLLFAKQSLDGSTLQDQVNDDLYWRHCWQTVQIIGPFILAMITAI